MVSPYVTNSLAPMTASESCHMTLDQSVRNMLFQKRVRVFIHETGEFGPGNAEYTNVRRGAALEPVHSEYSVTAAPKAIHSVGSHI